MLQVLDKHTSPTFSLRDMELLAVFARQAAAAIRASARPARHDAAAAQPCCARRRATTAAERPSSVEALVSARHGGLDTDEEAPFWQLVDRVARLRDLSDRELRIVSDILEVVADHATPAALGGALDRSDPAGVVRAFRAEARAKLVRAAAPAPARP